jgi:hypothetical protein
MDSLFLHPNAIVFPCVVFVLQIVIDSSVRANGFFMYGKFVNPQRLCQDRQALQQLQAQQQQSLQQQSLHQQLQSSQLQSPQQNTLLQANQGRSQLNQLGTMSPLYGNPQSSLLPSGLMASMNQGGQSQAAMMQQQYLQGNQSQRNLSTQMLSDPC